MSGGSGSVAFITIRVPVPPVPPQWPFLRTYKPMLKRARGTPSYEDIRTLLKLWLHAKRLRALLDVQNERLLKAARERDRLR